MDFFSEDGNVGIAASNRIRGVVLHDILAGIVVPADLDKAVRKAVDTGEITAEEASEIRSLLAERITQGVRNGWFPEDASKVLNETSLIASSGRLYRPDRVVLDGGKVVIIDYKFGEHYKKYEKQLTGYADLWRKMGYEDVSAILWYVHTGEIMAL